MWDLNVWVWTGIGVMIAIWGGILALFAWGFKQLQNRQGKHYSRYPARVIRERYYRGKTVRNSLSD